MSRGGASSSLNYRSSVVLGADGERVLKVQWFVYRISFNFAVLISFPAFAWLFWIHRLPDSIYHENKPWLSFLRCDSLTVHDGEQNPGVQILYSDGQSFSCFHPFFWCALLVTWRLIVWDMSEVFVIRISFFLVVTTHLTIFPIASFILRAFLYFSISPK